MNGWRRISIKWKMLVLFLFVGLVPVVSVALVNDAIVSEALDVGVRDKLTTVRVIKTAQIEGWLGEKMLDLEVFSAGFRLQAALGRYASAFPQGADSEAYKGVDEVYGAELIHLQKTYGYYDLFLISMAGDVVYSAEREPDFGTNLLTGRYKNSGLAEAFRTAKGGTPYLTDFSAYAPSNGAAAAFVARRFKGADGVEGVLALQLPAGQIDAIMNEQAGLGESGETYVVAADKVMRSDSRFAKESTRLKRTVDTETVGLALKGESGCTTTVDYRGTSVMSCYGPIAHGGLHWALLAEMDTSEATAAATSIRDTSLMLLALFVVVIVGLALVFTRGLTGPLRQVTSAIAQTISTRDLTTRVEISAQDEMGELADGFNTMIEWTRDLVSEVMGTAALLSTASGGLKETSGGMVKSSAELRKDAGDLASTVEQVAATAQEIAASVTQSSEGIQTVAAAVTEMSANVGVVASGSEEMSSVVQSVATAIQELNFSLSEVSVNCAATSTASQDSLDRSRSALELITEVDQAARQIDDIVSLIEDIADRTNLLALNATIEAASAGEAGRGFAVVASEVKALAQQTAGATRQIAQQVAAIQGTTSQAVASIREVNDFADSAVALSEVIAAAVEEQTATTSEVAESVSVGASAADGVTRSVTELSGGLGELAQTSGEISSGISQISVATEQVSSAFGQVAASAQRMDEAVAASALQAESLHLTAEELGLTADKLGDLVASYQI